MIKGKKKLYEQITDIYQSIIRRLSLSPTGYKLLKLIHNHWGYSIFFLNTLSNNKSEVSKDHKK